MGRSFSVKDVTALTAVGVLLVVGLIGCGGTSKSQRIDGARQLRGIHQACVLFSQSNNEFYPGRNVDGRPVDQHLAATDRGYGAPKMTSSNQSMVFALLLNGEFFTPEYLIAPGEPGAKTIAPTPDQKHTLSKSNYSFATLQVSDMSKDTGRLLEWKDTNNSQAPIIADRSQAIDSSLKTISIHGGSDPAKWTGSVAWNDNHVTFEQSSVFQPGTLKFGSVSNSKADDLFKANDGETPENNAMFVH